MLTKFKCYCLTTTLLLNCILTTSLDANTQYGANKVLAFPRMGQAIVSPNGQQVAFITLQVKPTSQGKKWQTSLYLQDKNKEISLIDRLWSPIINPQWMPDGKQLTFLAKGAKHLSIWTYSLASGNKSKLFEFTQDIGGFKWSNNENYLAFVAAEPASKNILTNTNKNMDNNRLYLLNMQQPHKTAQALTPANISITQISGNGLVDSGFDWAPSNESIVFAYQAQAGATDLNKSKIAIVEPQTKRIMQLPFSQKEVTNQPLYSPNGKWIAFRASSRNEKSLDNNPFAYDHICISNTASLKTRCLQNTPNAAPMLLGWSDDSQHIFVFDNYQVQGPQIYSLPILNKMPVRLVSTKQGYIDPTTISLNYTHRFFAFSWEDMNKAPRIFITTSNIFQPKTINSPKKNNQSLLGHSNTISWKSTDGKTIQGLLITPLHYNAKKKHPLLVIAHGGPAGASVIRYLGGCEEYGEAIVPHCSANLLNLGFIIFEPNPRGSTGYGKAFRFANVGDLGGHDYQDVISGIDYLVKTGIVDAKHLAIFGWSYGGYMTAWSVTQTHRFKAAIEGDGLTDLLSFTGTTDIPWFLPQYLGSTFWHNPQLYLQRSPILHVQNITTPLLILHGEKDIRVPLPQAHELYSALKLQHKKVKLLLSPGQRHVPTNPNITAAQIQAVDNWLQQALR